MKSKYRFVSAVSVVGCAANLTLGCGSGDSVGASGSGAASASDGSSGTGSAGVNASGGGASGAAGASTMNGSSGAIATAGAAGMSSGGSSDAASCPGTVIASWDADGVPWQSSTPLFIAEETNYTFNCVACLPATGSGDKLVEFGYPPEPVAPGTFPLTDSLAAGMAGVKYGALYIDGTANYRTDADHSGSLVITDVDNVAHTFDGTFSFSAITQDGLQTVNVSNGKLTKFPFMVLSP